MSDHKCHCQQPATWMIRVVPTREVVLVEGHLPEVILAPRSIDTWATCDQHLAESARSVTIRNDMDNAMLVLTAEGDD
jgi:hypothetical protein